MPDYCADIYRFRARLIRLSLVLLRKDSEGKVAVTVSKSKIPKQYIITIALENNEEEFCF